MYQIFSTFIRYFITGGVAAILDLLGFAVLSHYGISVPISAVSSFTIAALVNYQLTSVFVFQKKPSIKRFYIFFCFASIGLAINASVTVLSVKYFNVDPLISKILGIGIAFFINFFLNLLIVFKLK